MFVRLDAFLNVSCSTHLVALRFFFSKAETFPASSSCMFRMQWQVLITCAKVGVVAWFSLLFQLLVMTQTVCCFFTQLAHMGPYALSEVAFRLECQCLGFFFFFFPMIMWFLSRHRSCFEQRDYRPQFKENEFLPQTMSM